MAYGWFNWSKQPDPAIDKACKGARRKRRKRRKRERLENLRRKYHDVPLNLAVMQLFWREGRLTISDITQILETDEDTVKWEIDRARQNAR